MEALIIYLNNNDDFENNSCNFFHKILLFNGKTHKSIIVQTTKYMLLISFV